MATLVPIKTDAALLLDLRGCVQRLASSGRGFEPNSGGVRGVTLSEQNTRARIGLFGQFGIGNLGNDGSLEAMLRTLERIAPEARLECICTSPDFVRERFGLGAEPIVAPPTPSGAVVNGLLLGFPGRVRNFSHAMKVLAELNALIVPGAGVLDDFRERPSGLPYDLWRWCRAAKFARVPVAFVSVGAGPIRNRLSRLLMSDAARCAGYRTFRDRPSAEFAVSLGLKGQARVVPDLAFGLPAATPLPRRRPGPLVAVGVMTYYGWSSGPESEGVFRDYLGRMSAYVRWLLASGRNVRLVIGNRSDALAANEIVGRIAAEAPLLADMIEPFEPAQDLHDVMSQFAGTDVGVATRYHNVVCALRVGLPVISLGYSEKNAVLLEDVGLGGFSQHVETLDLELLKLQTERLISEAAGFRPTIEARTGAYRTQLQEQERELAEYLRRDARAA